MLNVLNIEGWGRDLLKLGVKPKNIPENGPAIIRDCWSRIIGADIKFGEMVRGGSTEVGLRFYHILEMHSFSTNGICICFKTKFSPSQSKKIQNLIPVPKF